MTMPKLRFPKFPTPTLPFGRGAAAPRLPTVGAGLPVKMGSQLPRTLMDLPRSIRQDSGLEAPPWEAVMDGFGGSLPQLPFEGKLTGLLSGDIEGALPSLPWER